MALATSVRVEATSTSTAVLRWSYAGTTAIGIWRSIDGASYSEVTTEPDRVAVGTTSYTDEDLSPATKYWYKLSDDAGSTFSSVVTVWTHVCLDNPDGSDVFALPRFSGESDPNEVSASLDEMAQRIEEVLGTRVMEPQQCSTCPIDGALVINCASGCKEWIVVADQDINSISMQWCDGGDTHIDFVIPPNTTRQICGFSGSFGFSGDECFSAPIVAGAYGRTVSVGGSGAQGNKANPGAIASMPGYGGGTGRGGGGGGGGCNCTPSGQGVRNLTIKSCNANNSLDCSSTKSLQLKACGGIGPYTWSKTGSVVLSTTTGPSTTVTPPTNSGSAVAGTAYIKYGGQCQAFGGAAVACNGTPFQIAIFSSNFGCNDQVLTACGAVFTESCPCSGNCTATPIVLGLGSCGAITTCGNGGFCTSSCDARTAAMITANCNPCGSQSGATVSVTDSIGTVTTVILRA